MRYISLEEIFSNILFNVSETEYCLSNILLIPFIINPNWRKLQWSTVKVLYLKSRKVVFFFNFLCLKLSKSTSPVTCHVIPWTPAAIKWKGQFSSVVFFPKSHNPILIMRKIQDKPKLNSTNKYSMKYSRTEKENQTEKPSQTRRHGGDLTTKCSPVHWRGSWTHKGD